MEEVSVLLPVDGGEVWVQDRTGTDPTVVLLHPGWGDSTIWDGVEAQLSDRARVVRYDTRGYDRSPAPQVPFTPLDDLVAVLDGLEVERAVVVGHSGGGATAVSLAMASPERVASLILVAPGVGGYPWPGEDPFLVDYAALTALNDLEGVVELGLRTWCRAGADRAAQSQIRRGLTGQLASADHLRPEPDAYSRLGQLPVATTLVIGELEYPMVADCVAAMARRIPGCQVVRLPGVDHLVPLRAPEVLAHLIDGVSGP